MPVPSLIDGTTVHISNALNSTDDTEQGASPAALWETADLIVIESAANVTRAAALLADVSVNDLFVQRKVKFGDIAILRLQAKPITTCSPHVGEILAGSASPPSLSKGDTLLLSSSPFGLVAPQVWLILPAVALRSFGFFCLFCLHNIRPDCRSSS
jgi:hypothetical protein